MTTDLGIGNIMLSIFFLLTNRFSRYLLSEKTPNGLDTLKFQCETIISIQQRDVVCMCIPCQDFLYCRLIARSETYFYIFGFFFLEPQPLLCADNLRLTPGEKELEDRGSRGF